jgi:hypothetical protein
LASGATAGDELNVYAFSTFNLADVYTKAQSDARYPQIDTDTLYVDATNNRVGVGTTSPLSKLDIKGDTTSYAGMAKIYLTDVNSDVASRNWSIGNGGTAYGNLTFSVSAAKDGNAGDVTSVPCMVLDSSGRVTKPSQPIASFSWNAEQALNTLVGSNTMAVFSNIGNHLNTSTGRFTCPIAGRYRATFTGMAASANHLWVVLRLNGSSATGGSDYLHSFTNSALYARGSFSMILDCAANDILDFRVMPGSYAALHTQYGSVTFELIG